MPSLSDAALKRFNEHECWMSRKEAHGSTNNAIVNVTGNRDPEGMSSSGYKFGLMLRTWVTVIFDRCFDSIGGG